MLAIVKALLTVRLAFAAPPHWEKAATARWIAQALDWGTLSTTSTRSEASKVGDPFGNPYSFAAVSGTPYLFASMLDASMIDLFENVGKPRASLALSEAEITKPDIITRQYCSIGTLIGDPENPPCARLVLSGTMVKLEANSTEDKAARMALFKRHPSFAQYPPSHDFFVAKMEVDGVWLIDFYGGAAIIPPTDYFGSSVPLAERLVVPDAQVLTESPQLPPHQELAATARWMAHTLVWGVLSTVSTRSEATRVGDAFGNPNSFADVGGTPYLYVSNDDASMIDVFVAKTANPRASLALTEASLLGTRLARPACTIGSGLGDPENPPCARLVLSGKLVRVAANSTEEQVANKVLFAKHPSFTKYPKDHAFYTARLEIDGVWLIDFYGGAGIIKPADYFAASPTTAASFFM